MPGDEPAPEVRAAMARLLEAAEAYTRAFDVWTAQPQRQEELLDAERRLEDAQRQASQATLGAITRDASSRPR